MRHRSMALVTRDDQILMIQTYRHNCYIWELPGGGIEPGETPEEAAVRELKEECGMDGKVKPEEQQEIFGIICRKSASMNDMVNTLFDYAKLGTEGYHADMAQLDLTALIRGIIAEHYTDFEENGIELDIDLPDSR